MLTFKSLYPRCARMGIAGHEQQVRDALVNFRMSIGLPPDPPAWQLPSHLVQIGEWVDQAAEWDLFATITHRPQPRRSPNPRGLARLESRVRRSAGGKATLAANDF